MDDKVFISYRRDDSIDICGRIYDRLSAYFGRSAVFKDVDSIPLGVNFATYISTFISRCAVQLVVIGPRWATIANERGRRLDDPADFVRLEVEAALGSGLVVVPVLVGGAEMPRAEQLPPGLRPLAALPPLPVDADRDFDADIVRLMRLVARWVPPVAGAPPLPNVAPARVDARPRRRLLPRFLRSAAARRLLARVAVPLAVLTLVALVGSSGLYLSQQLSALQAVASARQGFLRQVTRVPGTNQVWIAGGVHNRCLIERFDGQALARMDCPYNGVINAISMLSPTDGWAGGASGLLLHYTGGRWVRVSSPTGKDIDALTMFSPTDGWAASTLGKVTLHYTGGAWSVASPGFTPRAFARVSDTEGWAVGTDGDGLDQHIVFHYVRGQWQAAQFFQAANFAPYLTDVQFVPDGTEGWAVGFQGAIAHYVRGVWLQAKSPVPKQSNSELRGISATSPGEAWAVGGGFDGPTLFLHYTSKGWQQFDIPWQADMADVVALPDGEAWAMGQVGSFADGGTYSLLLRYRHGAWSAYGW